MKESQAATVKRSNNGVESRGISTNNTSLPSITKTTPEQRNVVVLNMNFNDVSHKDKNSNQNNHNNNNISKNNKTNALQRKPRSKTENCLKESFKIKHEPHKSFSSMLAITPNLHHDESSEGELNLSDSMTQRNDKLDEIHPTSKHKKHKKKSKFTQMIAGVSYKSKVDLFQKLFKDTNSNEKLIIDYSCAFHRDILVHGRLYLSQNWLCFYANIFGWETLITVQWCDVTAITKEKTAKVIPNAIQVLTDTEKYFFTTFVTRENAYTALFRIWQNALLGHPMQSDELKTICRKYRQKKSEPIDGDPINDDLDETGDEVAEEDFPSTNGSTEQLNRLDTQEDATAELLDTNGSSLSNSYTNQYAPPPSSSDIVNGDDYSKSVSSAPGSNENTSARTGVNDDSLPDQNGERPCQNGSEQKDETMDRIKQAFKNGVSTRTFSKAHDLLWKKNKKKKKHKTHHQRGHSVHIVVPPDDPGETTTDFDEAASDASTDDRLIDEEILCPCHDSHKGKEYANAEFNFDVDALCGHLFSPESDMMKRVFEERKHENWKYTPLEKDESGCDSQTLTYTLSLNYSIGPKTSDTVCKQTFLKENKPGAFYIISTVNRSVGVPYSDSFHVSVRYCITRCSGNRSRLKVYGEVVYVKRVFGLVKNMISRNGEEAMRDYYVYLVNVLNSESQLILPCSSTALLSKRKKLTKKLSKDSTKVGEATRRKSSHGSTLPAISHVSSTVSKTSPVSNSLFSSTTSTAVLIIILLLFGMNVYLLRRLRGLEGSILITKKAWVPKDLPSTEEGWKDLLQQQKNLHDFELIKLKEVVGNTALLLKQVEGSISSLYNELDKNKKPPNGKSEENLPLPVQQDLNSDL